ncbi:MAG: hypothetical protein C4586_05150 [Anaerolineaceae bacterium]|nr:MAG: hypothetical protein C4586_05150 [Anaerolineaceae bacterium]
MNKPVVAPPALTVTPASVSHLQPARRLIVLVPRLDADLTAATRRVWELADATGAHVQFLGLYNDPAQEPSLRRELVTMSAMVKDGRVSAEANVILGKDWVAVVKSRWQAGDTVVCFDEQRVGLSRRPLSQILQSDLDVPLYILSGLYPQNDSRSNWPAQAAAWIGSLAIILGFLALQVKTIHLAKEWTITLQLLSIPLEAWSIWVWNSLVG